jgi:hypothetical protein
MTTGTTNLRPGLARDEPFIGPQPFSTENRRFFFGRDREARELLNVLIAQRVVLMYAPSGAGKTSLLHARIIPDLEESGYFVAPIIRVALTQHGGPGLSGNAYVDSLLTSLGEPDAPPAQPGSRATPAPPDDGPESLARQIRRLLHRRVEAWSARRAAASREEHASSAATRLSAVQRAIARRAAAQGETDQGAPEEPAVALRGIVLIFDQFEEILTADPIDLEAKRTFFERVGEALRGDHGLWALFGVREDYAAALERYFAPMPGRLQVRFRFDLLDERAAALAISQPIKVAGASIATDAVDHLVTELRKVRLQRSDPARPGGFYVKEVPGPYVEPVQLQVVCDSLWTSWRTKRPGAATIELGDVRDLVSVDQALEDYYQDGVRIVATRDGVHDIGLEMRLRQWIERQLITPSDVRSIVLCMPGRTQGLENELIEGLVDQYLVRSDRRRGEEWFELAHDRLVAPIRKNNADWSTRNLVPFQLKAVLWETQGGPDELLLGERELAEAESKARAHPTLVSETDRAFLRASRANVAPFKYLFYKNLAIGAFAGAIVALLLAITSVYSLRKAVQAERAAEKARRKADQTAQLYAKLALKYRAGMEALKKQQDSTARAEQLADTSKALASSKEAENTVYQRLLEQQQSIANRLINSYINDRAASAAQEGSRRINKIEEHMYSIDYVGGSLILKQGQGIRERPVPVTWGGTPLGEAAVPGSNLFNVFEIYDQTPGTSYFPLIWTDLVANTYLRSTYQTATGPGASLGTAVIGSPSFRARGQAIRLVPEVTGADLSAAGMVRIQNTLQARFGSIATVKSVRSYPDPVVGRTTTRVSVSFEVLQDIALEPRERGNDAFRLLTVASMYSSDQLYDANVLRYAGPSGAVQPIVRISDLLKASGGTRPFHLFRYDGPDHKAPDLGAWFELVKEPGSGWFPDSPSIRIELGDRSPDLGRLGIQGYLDRSDFPSEDSLNVWVEWLDAPEVIRAGTKLDLAFTIIAQPPAPVSNP